MPRNKNALTYEQIARKYDITVNRTQTVVKSVYNKIVKALLENENISIFEVVLALRDYFNMDEQEAFDKLNDTHKEMLIKYASEHYKIDPDGEMDDKTKELFKF